MENTKQHLGHARTPKQQMDALVQLLCFDASKIDHPSLLKDEFSFQWTKEGGKVFPKQNVGWADQEYSFHQDIRRIIRGRDGKGLFKTYQDGLKASLAKAFDDLITSNDANAFHKFFQKFADELMICMDALDRAINLAIETTLSLGIYQWYPKDSIEVNLNRFMKDVITYQICQNCNTLKCKNDSWDSVKTKVDFWRPAIRLSNGKVTEEQVKQYIDDYLKDYDELADQFKCPFENGNGRNHNPHYGRRQAPYNPYYGRHEPQNPYSNTKLPFVFEALI
jgi:hypothetical protein